VHPFAGGRKLILGGVEIPSERGLAGHSDADVITHAVCNAALGAAGLGDLGRHFPDGEPAWKDVSSLALLERVGGLVRDAGWRVAQVERSARARRT
jgi:2-C-methyl-D-erythritol 2,4-cyclodiphosphate synthase